MRDEVWREGERMSGRDRSFAARQANGKGRKVYLQRENVRECTA